MEMKKKKRKFKTPNTYVIIFMVLVLVAILTWIIPGGAYKTNQAGNAIANTYHTVKANHQGIWDIIEAPIIGMVGNAKVTGAITISLNVLMFGSFLEMMDKTGAVNIALRGVAEKYRKNQYVLISVLTCIMGIFGTVQGSYEEGFVYLLMFLPIILSLGLDTIVALMIVILGTQAGCAASIVNPFSTGIASGIAGISPGAGLIFRVGMFVVLLALVSTIICLYAKKIQAHPEKSPQYGRREADLKEFAGEGQESSLTKQQRKVFHVFILTFAIMIISLVPWTSLNPGWTLFDDLAHFINHTPILSSIIGSDVVPFGNWYFNEINGLLLVMTFIAGKIMHYSTDDIINTIIKGAAGLVSTAFIIPLARGIQVLMTNGNITATVLHACEATLGSLSPIVFVIVCLAVYILLASFIPSSTGLAAATMSIMAPLATFAGVSKAVMVIIYNLSLGIVKTIMPTSIIVMTCIQAAHVNYGTWIKVTWKPVCAYVLVSCLILIAAVLVKVQ
ncbi:YfcC family protein [Levilactobacillus mulengensis]|uniref:YfcC family protein n=1 Tax=Levilactobacillus mulengensis TaxID=2486025 RepID=UPI000F76E81A|nr:YfcC family protein [Levilactobacillus mulengensis]